MKHLLKHLFSYEDEICHQPKLDINNSEILQYIKFQPPLKCNDEQDWVEIEGSTVRIKEEIKKKYGDVECQFTGYFLTTFKS